MSLYRFTKNFLVNLAFACCRQTYCSLRCQSTISPQGMMAGERGAHEEGQLGKFVFHDPVYITWGAKIKVCQWNSSLPLMPYRHSIQSALLIVCKISAIMLLGAQTNREHQSTRTQKESPQHKKSFSAIAITVVTKSKAIKDLIIYLHQVSVIWFEIIT